MVPIADLLASQRAGYWGEEAGTSEVDVFVIRNGDILDSGDIRWGQLPVRGLRKEDAKKARVVSDDIVLTVSGDCGYAAYVRVEPIATTCASNFVRVLHFDAAQASPRYVFHFMHRAQFRAALAPFIRGTTMKNLVVANALAQVQIPLPSIPEQRQIADVLDKAAALSAMRQATITQLDTLTQSIFLDMFGDPASNPKGWPRRSISDVATVITGNTPSRAFPEYYGTEIEWIKSDNINTPHYYVTRAEEGLSALGKQIARVVPAGSTLVTCIAGSPECIGNAAMTDREVAFNQQINALVPRSVDPHFLYVQLLVGKRLIQRASTSAMKGMVSKSRFSQLMLMCPPMPIQRQFASRIIAVERLKSAQWASLAGFDGLFASLQHRAFRGEL